MLFQLSEITGIPWLKNVEYHEQLGSTNDRALRLAAEPSCPAPSLVLCDSQTAGRGRGANRWWATTGALTFSLIVEVPPSVPAARRAWLSLLVGLGVRRALESHAGRPMQVKWPNDVYLAGRKVCGVLIEMSAASRGRAIVGVGVNVNNSLREAPPDIQARAVTLADHVGRPLDATRVLVDVLEHVWRELGRLPDPSLDLATEWAPHCLLTGKAVRIDANGRIIAGQCQGIGADGELLVRTPESLERIVSGVVAHFS